MSDGKILEMKKKSEEWKPRPGTFPTDKCVVQSTGCVVNAMADRIAFTPMQESVWSDGSFAPVPQPIACFMLSPTKALELYRNLETALTRFGAFKAAPTPEGEQVLAALDRPGNSTAQ